jgi:hypothetical protein
MTTTGLYCFLSIQETRARLRSLSDDQLLQICAAVIVTAGEGTLGDDEAEQFWMVKEELDRRASCSLVNDRRHTRLVIGAA